MKPLTMLTGGARSGKSRMAVDMATACSGRRVFIATAEAFDDEMKDRIARHQAERGNAFETREVPQDLAGAILDLPSDTRIAVIDCLTVWLGNLMHHHGENAEYPEVNAFLEALEHRPCEMIVITNELGMSIVPPTPSGRRFRDVAGRLNQEVARRADRVLLIVSGLPLALKGGLP